MNLGDFFKGKDGQSPDKSKANNPRAILALQHVTRGATDAFSNVGRHVNGSLRKFSVKSVEAGAGSGFGFGHGFGVGLSAKPGVMNRFQSFAGLAMLKMMMKLGIVPSFPFNQSIIPGSLQSGMRMISGTSDGNVQSGVENFMQLVTKTTENKSHGSSPVDSKHEPFPSKGTPSEASLGSHSQKVVRSFLQIPILKNEEKELNDMAGPLRSENNMLHMLLKHQEVIEKLMEENKKLQQVLVEDLKVPPSKLKGVPSSDCIECRKRQGKAT